MAYDEKCYDLATVFLSDVQNPVQHEDADRLAQEIQRTIEDFLFDIEQRDRPEQVPASLKAEAERDMAAAVAQAKVWDQVFDQIFSPKVR